jgi:hypothetical protein
VSRETPLVSVGTALRTVTRQAALIDSGLSPPGDRKSVSKDDDPFAMYMKVSPGVSAAGVRPFYSHMSTHVTISPDSTPTHTSDRPPAVPSAKDTLSPSPPRWYPTPPTRGPTFVHVASPRARSGNANEREASQEASWAKGLSRAFQPCRVLSPNLPLSAFTNRLVSPLPISRSIAL